MIKKYVLFVVSALVTISFSLTAHSFDFSSDILIREGRNEMKGKIFVSGEKARIETEQMVLITRVDKEVVWMLMPSQKMYTEQSLNPNMIVAEEFPDEVDRRLVGEEKIDGKLAQKYLVTVKMDDKEEKVYQWLCKEDKLPLKTASFDNKWSMEFKELKKGKQSSSLFELPGGYNKLPAGLMQMPCCY